MARETGSATSPRVSQLIFHMQAESGAYSLDSSRFPRLRRPSTPPTCTIDTRVSQSGVYLVTQLRTDGVHRGESAGTGPVVLEEARVTRGAYSGNPMDQFLRASVFPTPTTGTVPVDMCLP